MPKKTSLAKDAIRVDVEKLTPEQFQKFRAFIYRKSGIQIDSKKITMLSNRIRRRVKAGSFQDFDAYFQYLISKAGDQELKRFLDVVTTHETSFFRTPKQFDWLRQDFVSSVCDEYRKGKRAAKAKLWSAGCANGAEAYSMAICLLDNAHRLRDWKLDILGTDISQENILAAKGGVFKGRLMELIPVEKRRPWFRQEADDCWQVRPSLKELVRFQYHNLMNPPAETDFDCVFIRNVLIYFDPQSKQKVIRNLLAAMKIGGYLVVGPSEGVQDLLPPLRRITPLIYQKVSQTDNVAHRVGPHPRSVSRRPSNGNPSK